MIYPIPDAVTQHHTAVLGKTGSGKSSTGKLMVEHVVAEGFRVCILDPIKSDWWGMIGEGTGPGLPFRILGGPHGHVPLPSSAGEAVGKLVASGQLPLSIVDMADFEAGGLQRFFIDFATSLMRSQKGVLYLVMEEAHEFAPKERAGLGGENMALHLAKKLATAGRSKGIRLIVLTQRVQSLHNAVLGSCESMVAHRLQTPADQKPVIDWVKANVPDKEVQREVAESLASLPTGTGWLCSGEAQIFERVAFPKFRTFDNAATPIADDEEITVKTAKVDTAELRSIIGAAVEEAEENDPKALKAKIAELQKAVAKGGGAAPDWPDLRERCAQLERAIAIAEDGNRLLSERLNRIAEIVSPKADEDGLSATVNRERGEIAIHHVAPPLPVEERKPRPRPAPKPDGQLNAAALTIAGLLKQVGNAKWETLLIWGGFRPGSGWIRKANNELREHGLATAAANGLVYASDELLKHNEIEPVRPPSFDELRILWADKLRGPGGAMAVWLAKNGPATRKEIATGCGFSETAGWSRKGFKDVLGSNLAHERDGKLVPNPLLVGP